MSSLFYIIFIKPPFCSIINNMNISEWLIAATRQLKNIGVESPRLDAELILAETLRKPRTFLHANLDEMIDPRRVDIADARLGLRLDRVPIAYILGYKEFYGRKFFVSPNVLIPRPESEAVISSLLEISASDIGGRKNLLDIGTGSGCLGITAKLERPELTVTLSDISPQSLIVAEKNANELNASVNIKRQDLLKGQIEKLDYIIANLPYVDPSWKVSEELRHEPQSALFANDGGLEVIYKLLEQAPLHLVADGWLLLEADPEQHSAIEKAAAQHGFSLHSINDYCLVLRLSVTA